MLTIQYARISMKAKADQILIPMHKIPCRLGPNRCSLDPVHSHLGTVRAAPYPNSKPSTIDLVFRPKKSGVFLASYLLSDLKLKS